MHCDLRARWCRHAYAPLDELGRQNQMVLARREFLRYRSSEGDLRIDAEHVRIHVRPLDGNCNPKPSLIVPPAEAVHHAEERTGRALGNQKPSAGSGFRRAGPNKEALLQLRREERKVLRYLQE